MASRTNLAPSIRIRPCPSDPPFRNAARSCFNRELEAEVINISGGSCRIQIVGSELPHTPSGRALTVSSQYDTVPQNVNTKDQNSRKLCR